MGGGCRGWGGAAAVEMRVAVVVVVAGIAVEMTFSFFELVM